MTKTDFKSFYTTPNFEAWQDGKFVYIHLMERGLDISFFKWIINPGGFGFFETLINSRNLGTSRVIWDLYATPDK